jgi:hypothetical protein
LVIPSELVVQFGVDDLFFLFFFPLSLILAYAPSKFLSTPLICYSFGFGGYSFDHWLFCFE